MKTKMLLGILAVFLVGVTVTVFLQWNNIQAFKYRYFYSDEKVEELLKINEEAINAAIAKAPEVSVRDLTEDEREKLNSGEITKEEVVKIITAEINTPEPTYAQPTHEQTPETQPAYAQPADDEAIETASPQAEATPDKLSELLAEVYILRAQFTNSLDNLLAEAKAEYDAIPENERTTSAKAKLGLKYINRALALEAECDAEMSALVSEIESELLATDGDTSLASDIMTIYKNEKSLKKSEYLSKYDG